MTRRKYRYIHWLSKSQNRTREVELDHRELWFKVRQIQGKKTTAASLRRTWRRWWQCYLEEYRPDLTHYPRYNNFQP